MDHVHHRSNRKVTGGFPFHRSILTSILGSRLFSAGYSLLPEEKLALSLSLLLLVASVIIFL